MKVLRMSLYLKTSAISGRGGVLEDVLGLEDVLDDTFSSHRPWPRRSCPWSWPRSLKSSKIACPRLNDSTIFEWLKFCRSPENFVSTPFFWRSSEKNFRRSFFLETLAFVSLVLGLGLEHFCPWPRECLSSERLSLVSDFFCVLGLGLEPCVLDSISGIWIDKDKTEWSNNPLPSVHIRCRNILRQSGGPAANSNQFTPDELFKSIMRPEICDIIIIEINQKGKRLRDTSNNDLINKFSLACGRPPSKTFQPFTEVDLLTFIGILIAAGVQGLREKIFQGVHRSIPGPPNLIGPPKPYQGAHAVKSFFA